MCFGNLVTMMNRLGHCENNTFGTEFEDAISVKVSSKSSVLTKQIVKGTQNRVFHSEWDNFNQMWRTVHRQPMRYFAGGIMLQEVNPSADEGTEDEEYPSDHSIPHTDTADTLPDFHVSPKGPA